MNNITAKNESKGITGTIKTIDDSEIPSGSPRSITVDPTGCKETTSGYLR